MTVNMGEGPADNSGAIQGQQPGQGDQTPVAPVTNEPAINPAWNPLLEKLPASLHGMVTPELLAWDKNVQQLVGKVHSEYEPWKPFKENNLDPNEIYQAWQAIQNLEANPQGFVDAVIEYYGLQQALAEQGQQPQVNDGDDGELAPYDIASDPEFQRVTGLTEQMANLLLAQHQQQKDAQMDQQLNSDLNAAKQKMGNFDEDFVLQRMNATGESVEQAVTAYQTFEQNLIAQSRNPSAGAPIIMGSGGGTPATATPVGNMSDKDRRAYIAQVLQSAQANGG